MEEDNFEESKREKNRNNFEELNNEIQIDEFEKLSIAKQRDELLKIKNTIQSFYLKNQMNYQIIDVKYNKLSDGKVVYEVVNRNIENNEIETKLFVVDEENKLEEYKPIDAKEIEAYAKIYNIDIKEDYNKKAEIEKQDIENLDKNKSKKSLNELQEEVKQQAEIKDMENKAGLKNIEELTKINGDKKFDGNIKGYSSSELQGNEKVSSKFTLNQILGMQYANYKILKGANGNTLMLGQKEDGSYEFINNDKYEIIPYAKEMSLASGDGSIHNVQIDVGIRVKGLSEDNDQCIGIYRDNDKYGTFYSRGYNSDEKMLGADIETKPYIKSQSSRAKEIVDRRENRDITNEQLNIKDEEKENTNTTINDVYDEKNPDVDYYEIDYEIKEYRENLDNPEKFDAEFGKQLESFKKDSNLSAEEKKKRAFIVTKSIIEQEKENDGTKDEENKEYEKSNEYKESNEYVKDIHGTPWGNPDKH